MRIKNILVACSALDYILITKILGKNYVLNRAESREDIINHRKKKQYHLLLIDVAFLLPDFEVLSGLPEGIPVIAMSSEPYDARNEALRKAGCCACYIRPIRTDLFGAFVSYWLNQYD